MGTSVGREPERSEKSFVIGAYVGVPRFLGRARLRPSVRRDDGWKADVDMCFAELFFPCYLVHQFKKRFVSIFEADSYKCFDFFDENFVRA